MRLVIDRSKWIRGSYEQPWEDGLHHCAVGFLKVQCTGDEFNALLTAKVDTIMCPMQFPLNEPNLHAAVVCVNDHWPDGSEREQKLTDLFGKIGVDVEFK